MSTRTHRRCCSHPDSRCARRATGALLRLEGLADALSPLRDAVTATDAAALPGGATVVPCGDTSLALVLES